MKAKLVDVRNLPDADPYFIRNLTPTHASLLLLAGAHFEKSSLDSAGNLWVTVSFPQKMLSGQVWLGFNSPQNACNVLHVGGLKIRQYSKFTFVEQEAKNDQQDPKGS